MSAGDEAGLAAALARVAEDAELRAGLGKAARAAFEESACTPEAVVEATLAQYGVAGGQWLVASGQPPRSRAWGVGEDRDCGEGDDAARMASVYVSDVEAPSGPVT